MLIWLKQLFKRRRETISGFPVSFGHVFNNRWPEPKRIRLYELISDPVMLDAIGTLQVRAASNVSVTADGSVAIAENNRLRGYNQFASDLAELARPETKEVSLSEWDHIADKFTTPE